MAYPTHQPSSQQTRDGATVEETETTTPTATGPSFDRIAAALGAWDESSSPGVRILDALAAHLTQRFPTADVTIAAGAETADVVVGDIGVVVVRTVNRADNLDATFGILAEQYDALVFYSDSLHADQPDTWRQLERRYTAGRLGIDDVGFVAGEKAVTTSPRALGGGTFSRDALLLGFSAVSMSATLGALLVLVSQLNEMGAAFYGAAATPFLMAILLVLFLTNV